jgi:uncharacterized membrane protein (DUF2068 family)
VALVAVLHGFGSFLWSLGSALIFGTLLFSAALFVPIVADSAGEYLYLAVLAGVAPLGFGVAHAIVTWGLWNLRKWAWIGAMLISGVYAVVFLLNVPDSIPFLAVPAAVVIYLYSQRHLFLSESAVADTY